MLLLSVQNAVDREWRPHPSQKGCGEAPARLIDPSVATKLWHMACVCGWGWSWRNVAAPMCGHGGRWRFSRINLLCIYTAAPDFLRVARVVHERMRWSPKGPAPWSIEVSNAIG